MPSLTNSIRLLAKLHHTTSPSSSPMPMPLCLAVIGPLTHLSAQFLLTGLQTTTVIAYSFSATTTISVLPIPGFPGSLSITGHGTVQMAETRKASDHILISRRWKSFVTNCRVYRGAELGNTDHRLLVAQLKLKLRANQHIKTQPRLDSSLLSDPNIAKDFCCAIRRTFDNLATDKVNDWQTFKESVIQSAHNVFGCFRSSSKKPWISERTLNIIDRRREARLRGDLTEYQRLNRQRNVAIAEDREKFWQAEAKHLESAANNNNMSRVFSLLRQARNGPRITTALVKDSNGNLIVTEANCLERWKEHFSLLLQHGTLPG